MTDAYKLPDGYPLRDPSVRTYTVRGEAVLAGGRSHDLLALNATARAVWECCDGTCSVDEIAEHLSASYDADSEDIHRGVCSILADWRGKQLVHFRQPGIPTDASGPNTFYVTFGDQHVEALINVPDFDRRFKNVCGAMHGPGDGVPLGRMEAHAEGDDYVLQSSWGSRLRTDSIYEAITWLKRRFVRRFVRARPDLLWFHAGSVSRDDQAVLCVGQGGSGKSTLLTSLYREGWTYFSDDVQPVDPVSGSVLPFPLHPVYREGGNRLMSPEELRALKKKRVYLESDRVASDPTPIGLIIFPTYQPDEPAPMSERAPASAIVKLAQHCFNKDGFQGDLVAALQGLVERAPAYTVEHDADHPSLEQIRPILPTSHVHDSMQLQGTYEGAPNN